MTNAQTEFLSHVKDKARIECVEITYFENTSERSYKLKVGYSPEDYQQFLESLHFNYDAGYGTQYLYGTIWYSNDTWSTRDDNDGSEWWEYNSIPEIPNYLTSSPLSSFIPTTLVKDLPPSYRSLAVKNHQDLQEYPRDNVEEILSLPLPGAFVWSKSPEGFEFWEKLNGGIE